MRTKMTRIRLLAATLTIVATLAFLFDLQPVANTLATLATLLMLFETQ